MIIYDKNYKLIGISRAVLGFLGYNDLDEFKTIHSDFAELFVEYKGYVYNFKNFSWINYVLYGGGSSKRAIISLKNSQEIETELRVKEILLLNGINGSDKYYLVELINEFFDEKTICIEPSLSNYIKSSPKSTLNENTQTVDTKNDDQDDDLATISTVALASALAPSAALSSNSKNKSDDIENINEIYEKEINHDEVITDDDIKNLTQIQEVLKNSLLDVDKKEESPIKNSVNFTIKPVLDDAPTKSFDLDTDSLEKELSLKLAEENLDNKKNKDDILTLEMDKKEKDKSEDFKLDDDFELNFENISDKTSSQKEDKSDNVKDLKLDDDINLNFDVMSKDSKDKDIFKKEKKDDFDNEFELDDTNVNFKDKANEAKNEKSPVVKKADGLDDDFVFNFDELDDDFNLNKSKNKTEVKLDEQKPSLKVVEKNDKFNFDLNSANEDIFKLNENNDFDFNNKKTEKQDNLNVDDLIGDMDKDMFSLKNNKNKDDKKDNLNNTVTLENNLNKNDDFNLLDDNFSFKDDNSSFKNDEKLTKIDNLKLKDNDFSFEIDEKDNDFSLNLEDKSFGEVNSNKENNLNSKYYYNIKEVSKNLGLDDILVKELVNDFISQVKSYKNDFDLSISEQNYQSISKLFVKLKGVSAYLMIDKISMIIDVAQKSVESKNIDKIKEAVAEINSYMNELKEIVS